SSLTSMQFGEMGLEQRAPPDPEAHPVPPPLPSHAAMASTGPTRLIRAIGRRPRRQHSMISVTQSPRSSILRPSFSRSGRVTAGGVPLTVTGLYGLRTFLAPSF